MSPDPGGPGAAVPVVEPSGLTPRHLDQLKEASSHLDPAAGLEDLFQVLADTARAVVGANLAVGSLSRDGSVTQMVQAVSLSDRYAAWRGFDAFPDGSGVDGFVCETNRPLRLTQRELEAHPRWRAFGSHASVHPPLNGLLAVPIVGSDGRNIGLLQVSDRYEGEFDANDELLVGYLALIGAQAIETRALLATIAAQRDLLEHSGARLEAVLAAVPGGIVLTDARGDVVMANGTALEVDDLPGLTAQACRAAGISFAGDDPLPVLSGRREPPMVDGDLFGVVDQDGSTRWLLVRAAPLEEPGVEPTGAVVVFVDNTGSVNARHRLARSEAHLRQSQRVSGVGSWERIHPSGELVISEEACRIAGLDPGDPMSPERFYELVHPDDQDLVRSTTQEALETAGPLAVQFRLVRPDGEARTVRCRGEVQVETDGSYRALIGTIRDVTDEEAESEVVRQSQRMETVGRLAGGLAHDLNNLLTVLGGHAELLDEVIDEPGAHASIEAISLATARAASLTRQLLEFGRREVLQPEVVDVNEVLETHQPTFRLLLPDQIRVIYDLHRDARPVRVDPSKLDQVLMNVVLNARDAMSGESGTLLVETGRVELDASDVRHHPEVRAGWYSLVSFTDTGQGMPPEVLDRVFDPFFTTKPLGEGTGMGLATSHGIVIQSGGDLVLSSEPGQGTVVRIYLPETSESARPADSPSAVPARPDASASTVLVVEDEAQLRELLERMLAVAGYHVLSASSGSAALDIDDQLDEPIDLLVTDVSMPIMGGHELAKILTDAHPGLPVLYISGYTEDSAVIRGIADQDIRFLPKPFTSSQLLLAVGSALDA